jgi:hypothetical protein
MAFLDDLAEFTNIWCAEEAARRHRDLRLREISASISWIDRKIRALEVEARRRPRVHRQIADLVHQRRQRELEAAFLGGLSHAD